LFAGCNPDGAGCFKPSGDLESINVSLPDYTSIDIRTNIDLHLFNSASTSAKLITGANLMPGIRMEVVNGVLYLENLNTCNWTRKYVNPIVEISNPDLISIIQRGFGKTVSLDTLRYDQLKLESSEGSGEFNLKVNIKNLSIVSNETANYYISGRVEKLSVGYYYADGIFYGEDLIAQDCSITHWGSNTIHLIVVNSINGSIFSFGNVILHEQMPLSLDVEETNSGKLLFQP
jgi:hypothetical protein